MATKVKISEFLKAIVKSTAEDMLKAGQERRKLPEPFGNFSVSFSVREGERPWHVFSGKELALDAPEVFLVSEAI